MNPEEQCNAEDLYFLEREEFSEIDILKAHWPRSSNCFISYHRKIEW